MLQTKFIFILGLVFVQQAVGHGENKPGPHGGFIKIPGVFHTELVPSKNNVFRIYLLDIEFKNPTVEKSQLTASLRVSKKELSLKCTAQKDYFSCGLPKGKSLNHGEIAITPIRNDAPGTTVVYKLPLSLETNAGGGSHH